MKVRSKGMTNDNPTPEELRGFTERMAQARITEFGNVNVQTRVTSRSSGSTYVVAEPSSGKTMTREEYAQIARVQDEYLADKEVIVIDGYIGNDPTFQHAGPAHHRGGQREHRRDAAEALLPPATTAGAGGAGDLHAEPRGAGLPGRPRHRGRSRQQRHPGPELRLLRRVEEGRPADVEPNVYDLGGLALHAGLKVIPTAAGEKVFMIIGLSGTGKTTTTFTTQNDSLRCRTISSR